MEAQELHGAEELHGSEELHVCFRAHIHDSVYGWGSWPARSQVSRQQPPGCGFMKLGKMYTWEAKE